MPDSATTQLRVAGLRSLAGIAAFRQALACRPAVGSLTVAANEDGTFTYAVVHRGSVDVTAVVASLAWCGPDGTGGPTIALEADGSLRVGVTDGEAGSTIPVA